jgi:uncharacterized membrane protein
MRSRWFGLGLAVALGAFALAVYGRLPARIPTHWDLSGEVDGWMPRFPGAFLMPATVAGLWAFFQVLPRIDPRAEHYERFTGTYWLLVNLSMLFLALIGVVSLGVPLGWGVDVGRVAVIGAGVLFVLIGNYLPRVRSNWWMGIRTPWTLSSESVWRRTHRLGGWTFVLAGLVVIASAFLRPEVQTGAVIGAAVLAGLVPAAYSLVEWRRERRASRHSGEGRAS